MTETAPRVAAPPHRGVARETATVVIDGAEQKLEVVRQDRINGGQQAYWSCPRCGVLRSHLYLVDGALACRCCHRLDYRSRHVLHPAVLDAREKARPEVAEGELLKAAEGYSRLSEEERAALADRLQDAAMRHFHAMHKLNEMAKRVRAG
jgi:hypothetical protein